MPRAPSHVADALLRCEAVRSIESRIRWTTCGTRRVRKSPPANEMPGTQGTAGVRRTPGGEAAHSLRGPANLKPDTTYEVFARSG